MAKRSILVASVFGLLSSGFVAFTGDEAAYTSAKVQPMKLAATAFYPAKFDLQSSLTIHNASSSQYTLMVLAYVALMIPGVLAYVAYV